MSISYAALADVAGLVPASAGAKLGGLLAENSSGSLLWLHLLDLAADPTATTKTACRLCSVTALVDAGWVAAGAGIGKTLTAPTDNTSFNTFDSVAAVANDRILVQNEIAADRKHNGIYKLTTAGDGAGVKAVLTRATDFDAGSEVVADAYVLVTAGTVYAGTAWYLSTTPAIIDTDPLVWSARAPALPIRVATSTQVALDALEHAKGGVGPFVSGLCWAWSTTRDVLAVYTGAASGVAVTFHLEVP